MIATIGIGMVSRLPLTTCGQTMPLGAIRSTVPTSKNWESDSIIEAFLTADELGGWISIPDPVEWWYALGKDAQTSKVFQDSQWQNYLLRENNTEIFIQLDPYGSPRQGTLSSKLPDELAGSTFASPAIREAFVREAVARVEWYQPRYVCLAMEINAYYEQQPEDFDHFVSLFAEARQAIKDVSPEAIVFVSFQYEQLLGRFGGEAGQIIHEPHWKLLEKFEPYQDAVGLSSYPMESMDPVNFGDPRNLPDDYYSRVAEHTEKPIVFAELGWSSDRKYGGSKASQAAFLQRFETLTSGLDLRLVNWIALYDGSTFGPPFETMGLLDNRGRPKNAFQVWKELWSGN